MVNRLAELRELEKAATPEGLVWLGGNCLIYSDAHRPLLEAIYDKQMFHVLLDIADAAEDYMNHWTSRPSTDLAWNQLRSALAALAALDEAEHG